jgi:hypothetical protein
MTLLLYPFKAQKKPFLMNFFFVDTQTTAQAAMGLQITTNLLNFLLVMILAATPYMRVATNFWGK